MASSWIEVVDTAVKIGLGATITALSAAFLSKYNHDKSLEKDYLANERLIIEQITGEIEAVTHSVLKYWSYLTDWLGTNQQNTDYLDTKIQESRSEVFQLFKGMSESEGKLLLLGFDKQQELLRDYGVLLSEFFRYAKRSNIELNIESLADWRLRILDKRKQFYQSAHKAYSRKSRH